MKDRMSTNKKIKQGIMYVVLTIVAVYTLFPIYFLFVNSFKSQKEIVASPISLPSSWDPVSYTHLTLPTIRLV